MMRCSRSSRSRDWARLSIRSRIGSSTPITRSSSRSRSSTSRPISSINRGLIEYSIVSWPALRSAIRTSRKSSKTDLPPRTFVMVSSLPLAAIVGVLNQLAHDHRRAADAKRKDHQPPLIEGDDVVGDERGQRTQHNADADDQHKPRFVAFDVPGARPVHNHGVDTADGEQHRKVGDDDLIVLHTQPLLTVKNP